MRTVIESVSASTGYLESSPIHFASGLSCIIGARGTCKSTVVETLRFLFNCNPERIKLLLEEVQANGSQEDSPSSKGLIRASLNDGTARCTVRYEIEGIAELLLLERSADSATRVYREGIQEVGLPEILDQIEVYSQGDLQRIAERPLLRLQLVDRPNQEKVSRLQAEREELASKLRELGPQIRRLRGEIDAQRSEIRSLDSYQRDLLALQANRPQLSPRLTAEREAHQNRRELIEWLGQVGKERVDVLSEIMRVTRTYPRFSEAAEKLSRVTYEEASILRNRLMALGAFMEQVRTEAARLSEESLGASIEALRGYFEREDESYFSMRREEQEMNETLRKEDALKQQIAKMEAVSQKVSALQGQLDQFMKQRKELRAKMASASDSLYELRLEQVSNINAEFGEVVLLTLRQGVESADYRGRLNLALQGSRIRNQEEVAADIATHVLPSDLIDMVEAGDARRLSDVLNRDLGQMTRLVSFLVDGAHLYDLEGIVFEDWLEITMYISGEPKPLGQLSRGQMATALLPLILRPAPYPLVFDQPEDDLDNAFIFTTLISKVSELKKFRQLIFVTHNANIPVLGEADRVIVMSMNGPHKAHAPLVGTVDESREHILRLLEGGAEAFRRRQERYGALVMGREDGE